jgi:DDE domain
MMTPPATPLYKRHRFPAEIIRHCVWLYFRFSLSDRDVQEMRAERGVSVSHEAVRYWGRKFGQAYANQLRRRRPRPGDKWHMDEAFLTMNGARYYLWRAVDQDDHVLDILVQSRRNKKAAKKFFKKLLKGKPSAPPENARLGDLLPPPCASSGLRSARLSHRGNAALLGTPTTAKALHRLGLETVLAAPGHPGSLCPLGHGWRDRGPPDADV